MVAFVGVKGILSGRGFGRGRLSCGREYISLESKSAELRILLTRLVIGSVIHSHLLGHSFLPNVSHMFILTNRQS